MQTHFRLGLLSILSILFTSALFAQQEETQLIFANDDKNTVSYPIQIISLIEQKCIGCHSEQGRSEDAKESLMWKDLQNMEAGKAIGLLEDIHEQIEDGTMPPEKIVKKYPSMELTAEEKAILKAWIIKTQDRLDKD